MVSEVLLLLNLNLIPEPQEITAGAGVLMVEQKITLVLPKGAAEEDRFAADYLARCLKEQFGLEVAVADVAAKGTTVIQLTRGKDLPAEGYRLTIAATGVQIEGADAAGIYYGTQTLRQCFRRAPEGLHLPCLTIRDWSDLKYRSIHYDTKHHQDKREYVESFIKDLASYKANVLVWEWEDKFAYRTHPEIGAPGAFTMDQMQALTRFARQHHVQIVPLVQGLGHVSYILKHPQYRNLREIPDSDWEFCPLKQASYDLLFDLWDEAMAATPGSEFLHIGSDETYELGLGEACGCKAKADAQGKNALMQIFIRKSVEHVEQKGRKAISWGGRWRPDAKEQPPKSMLFVDSGNAEYLAQAKQAGYAGWVYAPNPGIEPLWLPYYPFVQSSMWRDDPVRVHRGSFWQTSQAIAEAGKLRAVDGSITTSWDDSGLHNQCWMPRYVCAAEFSWKADGRDLETWLRRYYTSYFGPEARDLRELFEIMQQSSIFYYDTFERRVWHWGDIGRIHLPDFPRGDLEYNGFWRQRYGKLLIRTHEEAQRVDRALAIIDDNLARDVSHRYDFEIMKVTADLERHNVNLILMLGALEEQIARASGSHYADRTQSLAGLKKAQTLIEESLAERKKVYDAFVAKHEETRLPKGLSLPGKPYVFARDRARHFANRTPDMSFLIADEQKLDLEGYLARLKKYTADYEAALKK